MTRRRATAAHTIADVVRLLDKTTRVMQTLSMRMDVLQFGQRQCERRLGTLERRRATLAPKTRRR